MVGALSLPACGARQLKSCSTGQWQCAGEVAPSSYTSIWANVCLVYVVGHLMRTCMLLLLPLPYGRLPWLLCTLLPTGYAAS